ncbi:MAG: hypothetical protein KC468_08120, partial [Myxococcales bacterium]|nr:hypothetical protein [Myxococcales bacterium]
PFGSSARVRVYAKEDNDRAYDEPFDFAYFMRRGLDSLAYGGVGAFLIPRGFLTSITHRDLRERILLRHHLLGAYRIPSRDPSGTPTFPGQLTVVDLVIFRSRGGQLTKVDEDDEYIVAGDYFKVHPAHLLGKEEEGFRYAVIGEFDGFPPLVPRSECSACTIATANKQAALGSRSIVRGKLQTDAAQVLEPLGVNQVKLEAIASALVVGMRVDRYLALRAQGDLENAEELWRELHDALTDLRRANGNPWQWGELLELRSREVVAAQALLRAFERTGELVEAIRLPPISERKFRGQADDIEAQARWVYGEKQRLSVASLHAFHVQVGGRLSPDELLERLLATQRWFLDGEDWNELVPRGAYLTGHLWPKYDRTRRREDDPQARAQEKLLLDAIDPKRYEDLGSVSAADGWLPPELLASWLGATVNAPRTPTLERHDGLIQATGDSTLSPEANWVLGWMNHTRAVFNPAPIQDEEEFAEIKLPAAVASEIEKQHKLGKALSADLRRVMYEAKWEQGFRAWVEADDARREQVAEAYNRAFRGEVVADPDDTIVRIHRWTDDPNLQLKPHQRRAVKARAETRGGIVGF